LSAETIEAIRARKRPEFGRDDERVIFNVRDSTAAGAATC
jgi:hypothetical protein